MVYMLQMALVFRFDRLVSARLKVCTGATRNVIGVDSSLVWKEDELLLTGF
jgi:hypothetical protein